MMSDAALSESPRNARNAKVFWPDRPCPVQQTAGDLRESGMSVASGLVVAH